MVVVVEALVVVVVVVVVDVGLPLSHLSCIQEAAVNHAMPRPLLACEIGHSDSTGASLPDAWVRPRLLAISLTLSVS
jgi:hypothetical protein